jgi:sulfate permease, SulP family
LHGFPRQQQRDQDGHRRGHRRRTQVHSLATAATVVAALLFARPLLARFPTAALGAIVIYAAIRLIDVAAFRRLLAFRRTELAIALAACIGVLAFNILYGVLVAIGLSVADPLIRRPGTSAGQSGSGVSGLLRLSARPHRCRRVPAQRASP